MHIYIYIFTHKYIYIYTIYICMYIYTQYICMCIYIYHIYIYNTFTCIIFCVSFCMEKCHFDQNEITKCWWLCFSSHAIGNMFVHPCRPHLNYRGTLITPTNIDQRLILPHNILLLDTLEPRKLAGHVVDIVV